METKTCTKCNLAKNLNEFGKLAVSKDGLKHQCLQCCADYRVSKGLGPQHKEPKGRNKENHAKWRAEYYATNKERLCEYSRDYRAGMSDEQKAAVSEYNKEYCKEYYIEHKEEIDAANKLYAIEHKEQLAEAAKNYRVENKDHINEKKKELHNKKMQEDIQYKLAKDLRKLVCSAINKNSKFGRGVELLGCDIDEYKGYLECQFNEFMNWYNYGLYWQIDHIIPVSSFDLTIPEEQERCFNFTNTRPLTVEENMKKSNHILVLDNI